MAETDELFELVSSLSMQEKRHFKLFAGRYGEGGSNYTRLFDAVASLKTWDEQKLKKKLKDASFLRHLPFEKHRLAELIRRALRVYHHDKTIDLTLKEMLVDAEILHEKSLYAQCRKTLRRAREKCRLYERFAFIPEITRLESRLFDLANLDDVYREEAESLSKMSVINEYRRLSNRVAAWVASSHQVRSREDMRVLEKIMQHPFMKNEACATSFTARVYFFYIQSVYHEMRGEQAAAYRSRKRFAELIEKDPAQKEVHVKNYLSALNNLGISQLTLGHYAEARETVQKIRMVASLKAGRAEDVRISSFVFSTILSLNIAIRSGNFQEEYARLSHTEKTLEACEAKILPQFLIVIHNSMKHLCFVAGNFRRALHWSNRVINEADRQVRQDIQALSRIFNLILHYELGNRDLLEYIIRSTYRYLLKSRRLFRVETIVLDYLRRNAHLDSRKEILQSFRKLHAQLLPLSRDEYEKKAFAEFDLLAWLESKTEGVSFAEIVQRSAAKNAKAPVKRRKNK